MRLAIDDFGTGYSSLSYLQRLPIDTLKIDRSFVERAADRRKPQIVRRSWSWRATCGLDVVAEGVETAAPNSDMLREMGSDFVQGYFFFRPLDVEEATRALAIQAPAP